MKIRRHRSALYLPASNPRAIAKARELAADVIIIDLEDAVAPEAKAEARALALAALADGGFGDREVVVRVNAIDTDWGQGDLAALAGAGADAVLVPKIAAAADLDAYRSALGDTVRLWAMVETAASLFRLDEIAAAEGLDALVMGTNDLAKETGARLGGARLPFVGALGLAVAAARANGIAILDGVFNDFEDDKGFVIEARQAADFGMDGKTLIHPRQIAACNAAFSPDAAETEWARRILAAFDLPENAAKGAIRVDGKMVERLHLHRARSVVAAADPD